VSLVPAAERPGTMEAVEAIIAHEPEADQILREAVVVLYEQIPDARSVAVAFVENGQLAPGPIAGDPISGTPPVTEAVLYEGRPVAELWIAGGGSPDGGDRALLARICELLSPYCLVGWDTGGEAWEP
jgi:hypothetical protein